jgi:CheY-like chemotaxis protein
VWDHAEGDVKKDTDSAVSKILVIDDEESFCQVIIKFLSQQGFEVVAAPDGKAGVGLAAEKLPDLILCDLNMPGMDGYEVLAMLRTDERLADIPLIFLTGQSQPSQVRQGMNLGADDYLTKPVDLADLLSAIRVRLGRRQAQQQRQRRQLERAMELLGEVRLDQRDPLLGSFLVKTLAEKRLVKVGDIDRIIAYGEYSWVYWHGNPKGALLRKSLKQWLSELPGDQFIRVHRRAIVNLAWMERLEKLPDGRMQIHLRDTAEPILVSLRLAPVLNRKLKALRG